MRLRSSLLAVALPVVLIAACGGTTATTTVPRVESTTSTTEPSAAASFPVTVESDLGETTVEVRPARIAALSAPLVEILFAIGAGDQVVAVDLFTNFPPEAADRLPIDSFALNIESVAALDPDLVVLSFDPGEAVDGLAALGIPVVLYETPSTLTDVYGQIEELGKATGHPAQAGTLVTSMKAEIERLVDEVGAAAEGLTVYHETDQFSFYTPNSSSFIGHLYGLLGMENIADGAPDEFGSGFPQLSPEYIIASDPDIVFLASFGETVDSFAGRPGWESMTAVQRGHVYVLDNDIASRWGPRVVDLMEDIAGGIAAHGSG